MGVFGLMGLGRAGQTAGGSVAKALEELFKLKYLQQQEAAKAEAERQFREKQLREQLSAQLLSALAQSGLSQLAQYQGYYNPGEVGQTIRDIATAIQSGPGDLSNPVSHLFRIASEAAKKKRAEENYVKFTEITRKYAPNASPEALRNAFSKYMNGDPGWVLDLGVSQAEAEQLARNLDIEFKRVQTEATKASTQFTREKTATERAMRPLNQQLIAERIKLLRSQQGLTDAQAKQIEALLPERMRQLRLSNEVLQRKPELLDLQIEAARLENDLLKETKPAKVAEAYARVAELDARTALLAAQDELTRAQKGLTDARTAESLQRVRAVFEDRFMKLASTDANAAAKFYEANKDALEQLGYTKDVVSSMLDVMRTRQKFEDPVRKEALGVYQTYLDAGAAPPQSEWTKRINELKSEMLRSGIDEDTANNLLAVLLDKWRGLASNEELAWAKLRAEQSRFNAEGAKLWLQYVKEFNDNLDQSRNDVMKRLDAIQRKYGECVRLAGDPNFGFAYVQFSSDPTCREKLEQMRNEIEPLINKLNTINRVRNKVSLQIAQRVNLDTNLPPQPFNASEFVQRLVASGMTDPNAIVDALLQEASKRGYRLAGSREQLLEEVKKLLPQPQQPQPQNQSGGILYDLYNSQFVRSD